VFRAKHTAIDHDAGISTISSSSVQPARLLRPRGLCSVQLDRLARSEINIILLLMLKSPKNHTSRKQSKLNLNHQTLRILGTQDLTEVIGGISGGHTQGPTQTADLACCSF
jgi:hypothetical protein